MMTSETDNRETFDSNDLDWLAFCYIADELDAASRLQFESRLSTDQDARDAVVAALEQAIRIDRAAGQTPVAPVVAVDNRAVSQRWNAMPHWIVAAALVMVALMGYWMWPAATPPVADRSGPESQTDELADAWVGTLVSLEQDEFEDAVAEEYDVVAAERPNESWMFVALVELDDDFPESEPKTGEGDSPCFE